MKPITPITRITRERQENLFAALSEAQDALWGCQVPPRVHKLLDSALEHVRALNERATRAARRKVA